MDINNFHENIKKLESDTVITKSKIFSQNKEMFKYTIEHETAIFRLFLNFLTSPRCEHMKSYQNNKKSKSYPEAVKPRKKAKFPAIGHVLMYLCWLRNGFTTRMLQESYISKSIVSRYLFWTNLVYFSLRKFAIWSFKSPSVGYNTPNIRKRPSLTTRCIIDCREIFCQTPSSLSTQSAMSSNH